MRYQTIFTVAALAVALPLAIIGTQKTNKPKNETNPKQRELINAVESSTYVLEARVEELMRKFAERRGFVGTDEAYEYLKQEFYDLTDHGPYDLYKSYDANDSYKRYLVARYRITLLEKSIQVVSNESVIEP